MRLFRFGPLLLFSLVLGVAAGCTRSDRTPVHPARGQVFYDGRAIPHALVTLHPVGASEKDTPKPRGTVDKDGRFVLTTYEAGDGAPAGEYGVTVEWWLSKTAPGTPEGDSPPPSNHLPARYARVESSRLRVRIEPGNNEIPHIHLSR